MVPRRSATPRDTARPSSPPDARSWQLAHEMVSSLDSRTSWNSMRPRATLATSVPLSTGIGLMGSLRSATPESAQQQRNPAAVGATRIWDHHDRTRPATARPTSGFTIPNTPEQSVRSLQVRSSYTRPMPHRRAWPPDWLGDPRAPPCAESLPTTVRVTDPVQTTDPRHPYDREHRRARYTSHSPRPVAKNAAGWPAAVSGGRC